MRDGGDAAARIVDAMSTEVVNHAPVGASGVVAISVKCRVGIAERAEDFLPSDATAEEVHERLYLRQGGGGGGGGGEGDQDAICYNQPIETLIGQRGDRAVSRLWMLRALPQYFLNTLYTH